MTANNEHISIMVRRMGDVVCHYGQRDYTSDLATDEALIVTLCGLTVHYKGKQAVRFQAHNLDLVVRPHPLAEIANDTSGAHQNFHDEYIFLKGGYEAVLRWHNCFSTFQSVFRKDMKEAA